MRLCDRGVIKKKKNYNSVSPGGERKPEKKRRGDESMSHFHMRDGGRRGRWEEKRSTK